MSVHYHIITLSIYLSFVKVEEEEEEEEEEEDEEDEEDEEEELMVFTNI